MRGRICSVIEERIPLELLTRRSLPPPQVAEIQVVLCSKAVAVLAFVFCHLLHWVAFGQTQQDRPHKKADSEATTSASREKDFLSVSIGLRSSHKNSLHFHTKAPGQEGRAKLRERQLCAEVSPARLRGERIFIVSLKRCLQMG